ncbi:MAG: hydroxymethylbilane synthase [Rhodospirillaceae bacterium]|nr:hydroxymethylbilane synthase [Rhodospirillaceae bacterium]
MSKVLRIGTRGSALALWQANETKRLIESLPGAPAVELVIIKTQGDLQQDIPLWKTPGKGFFTAELDRAQLDKEVDVVVHSLKDLATVMTPGLALTAVLEREDPRDALVVRGGLTPLSLDSRAFTARDGGDLDSLPKGARIGTSSLRRRAFLAHARPDLKHMELRGNVPTRVKKLDDGVYDAIILATAGLKRLGLENRVSYRLPTSGFPNAVAQGIIGICTREGDAETDRWVAPLNHTESRIAADAERGLLRKLEGGCQVPVGALATLSGDTVTLYSAACNLDGSDFVAAEGSAPLVDAAKLGVRVAEDLLNRGATSVLAEANARRQAVQH